MATATTQASQATEAESVGFAGEQRILLDGIGWGGYETMLAILDERRHPQLAYFGGSLELMSPGYLHETVEKRLSLLVTEVARGLDILFQSAGQTTLKRQDLDAGVEGDDTFYIANAARVRGKTEIKLDIDPPPDLAIEVEITHPLADREAIFAALRVPELWVLRRPRRGKGVKVEVLHLGADGRYTEATASLAFPLLQASEIDDWVRRPGEELESEWLRLVHAWVRDVLVPRRAGVEGGERP